MLVSVLIDNYNYANYLGECLQSVCEQTYENIEIVVVDDGSSDNSKEIIESFAQKDKRIKPVFKQNGGQASAFNEGIKHCTGEIICFLDSDDLFETNKVEEVVQIYKQGYEYIVNDYELIGNTSYANGPYYPYGGHNLFLVYYLNFFAGSTTSNIAISKKVAAAIFPIQNERFFKVRADDVIVFKAAMMCELYFLDKQLSKYRIHGENLFACNYENHTFADRYERDKQMNIVKNEMLASQNIAEIFFKNPFLLLLEFKTKQVYDRLILKKYLQLLFFEMEAPFAKKVLTGWQMIRFYLAKKEKFIPKKRVHL